MRSSGARLLIPNREGSRQMATSSRQVLMKAGTVEVLLVRRNSADRRREHVAHPAVGVDQGDHRVARPRVGGHQLNSRGPPCRDINRGRLRRKGMPHHGQERAAGEEDARDEAAVVRMQDEDARRPDEEAAPHP